MIQLYDYYNQASQDLHQSLSVAGFKGDVIVIDPDGFLPEGILSPFTAYVESEHETGKPLFFDQVPVPDFWEITGNNQGAKVSNLLQERARISYAEGEQVRLVKRVDWLNLAGTIRQTDHYNKYGFCFAKTTYDGDGQAIFTRYVTREGAERILENHVTGDILLTLEAQPIQHFANRREFVKDFLKRHTDLTQSMIFNTLAMSFMVSFELRDHVGGDALVWQEPLGDEIPGNMRLILEDNGLRANRVFIPDAATYARAMALVSKEQQHKIIPLGYSYQFKRDNFVRKTALTLTNSDQIEQLETLVQALPDVTFRVAAVTEMSDKLMSMLRYPNVTLHQNASQNQIANLYKTCDLYLDINYSTELLQATRQAFDNNLLILAFEETAHGLTYTPSEHIYPKAQVDQMIQQIKDATQDVSGMSAALIAQGRHANYLDSQTFAARIQLYLGGQDA